jgi:hypothetical protein
VDADIAEVMSKPPLHELSDGRIKRLTGLSQDVVCDGRRLVERRVMGSDNGGHALKRSRFARAGLALVRSTACTLPLHHRVAARHDPPCGRNWLRGDAHMYAHRAGLCRPLLGHRPG